ncbi:PREDICTED: sialic acid-binding Ig-like lectin 14 isoform X2 [Chinchilla lanigera]|uniref:sialic acid-binding Ig-like lectin 14 isoform X2 n=1 Tax=Chinchilla lanigera TaxID=34839 RepID=UPI0006962596|nr:PREDICTED: sialic acid-binding Ig-like lectin 14 isoform X2 [Chinchilla lanigera]
MCTITVMSTPTDFLLESPLYSQPTLPIVLLMAPEMLCLLLLLLLSRLWQESLAEDSRYGIKMQQSVTVQEGLCAFVPCTVFYPWNSQTQSHPAYGYWYHHDALTGKDAPVATNKPNEAVQERTKGRFQLIGDPKAYNCSLSITDAKKEDAGSYFFRVERGDNVKHSYKGQNLFLSVTALTHTPEIQVPEMLKSGFPGEVICSVPWACVKGTPPKFSWKGAAIHSTVHKAQRSSVLTFTPQPKDHGTILTCQVEFPAVGITVKRTIQLKVSYAPPSVNVSIFWRNCTAPMTVSNGTSLPILDGQSLRLVCMADGNPPASLSWLWKSRNMNSSQVSASGVLELSSVGPEDGGEFTCRVHHPLGSQHFSLNLFVQGSPSINLCAAEKQEGFWPLFLTLIRAAAMGAGFLLTYVLTRVYYTRCGGAREHKCVKRHRPLSF